MDLQKLREDTPCTSNYLNHVSTSVPPKPVIDAVNDYFRTAVHYGTNSMAADDRNLGRYSACKATVARFLGAKQSELLFTSNGSQAISLVANGLEVRPGDNIVVDELSFIGNVAPWLLLRDRAGVEVRFAPAAKPGLVDLERLETLVDSRTRLVSLTHMPNSLGMLQPAKEVGVIARARGALFLLDAATTLGITPIDVREIGCDFLAASGRKNLRGPVGSGLLYVREGAEEQLTSRSAAWNGGEWDWRPQDWDWSRCRYVPNTGLERLYNGEFDFPSIFGMAAAVQYIEDNGGIQVLAERVEQLTARLLNGLAAIPAVTVYGSPDTAHRAGTVGINLRGVGHEALSLYLNDHNVIAQGHTFYCPGVLKLFGIEGLLRLCVHGWNTEEEIDEAVALLAGRAKAL